MPVALILPLAQSGPSVTDTASKAANDTMSSVGNLWGDITGTMGPQLGEFIPKFIGALVVLVVGYIIARVIAWVVSKLVNKTGLGDRLSRLTGAKPVAGKKKSNVGAGVGKGAFWIVMLFVAIAFLKALGLDSVSEPLNLLLTQFFAFIPKIVGAAAVGAVAFLVATLAKVGVQKGLLIGEVDRRLGLAPGTLSNTLPIAAFCFILLFFLPAIFGALQMPELSGPVQDIVDRILGFLPNLISASVILGIFFLIAKLLGTLVSNLLSGTGFNTFPQRMGLMSSTAELATPPSVMAGRAAMGVIAFLGITQAVEMLNLEVVSNFFAEATAFAVPVIVGVIILAIGFWLANLARSAILASSMENVQSVANAAFAGVMTLTGIIALKRMGLAGDLVDLGFGLALGGVALALGLSFGLGGREAAGKFMDRKLNR